LSDLVELTKLDEWRAFVRLIKESREYWHKEVLTLVAAGKYREADRAQAKYEYADTVYRKVYDRIKQLM